MTHSEARRLKRQGQEAKADGDVCHSKTPTTQPRVTISVKDTGQAAAWNDTLRGPRTKAQLRTH